ncbi:MAG: flagella basal body P-ring formation protein FlgA, partial [Congregibacter sp.]|nr:flagella basal body P-ring formation protein FlgA [Congregibacter sp.]
MTHPRHTGATRGRPIRPTPLEPRRPSATLRATITATMLAAACAASATETAAASTASQPHDDILNLVEFAALQAAAEQGLERVEVRVRPLDQRLRPTLCDSELEIVRPHSGRVLGPVSYGVRCSGSVPWTLYLRAEVTASVELPVLTEALPRGTILSPDDFEMVTRRITTRAADIIVDPDMAAGMELKRPLAAGSTLRHGHEPGPCDVVDEERERRDCADRLLAKVGRQGRVQVPGSGVGKVVQVWARGGGTWYRGSTRGPARKGRVQR